MTAYLVCPGLLGPLPRAAADQDIPRFPRLERFLARAQPQAADHGFQATLFELFGVPVAPGRDLPTAAICYQAEENAVAVAADTFLLHADPVYLRPDQDRLLATDFRQQPVSEADAMAFVEAFNRHFAADGLRLIAPHPQRWYLLAASPPADLRTAPLTEVLGRNLDLFLPTGSDAAYWRALLNEVQMLFHGLPINQRRQAAGLFPVSGLWFSGGGVLPAEPPQGYARCQGEDFLSHSLNATSSSQRDALLQVDVSAEQALCAGDPAAWLAALQGVEARIAELDGSGLCLLPCAGRVWHWRPGMRRRIWRKTRKLTDWLVVPDA